MRSFAEEKHSKTDQLLYSLPISVTSVVMAKYLAMLTVLLIPCAVMAFYPLILCMFGTVHLTGAYAALLAFFLLGASLISIGMFVSSLTESQVISAVISLLAMILINFMSGLSGMYPTSSAASLAGLVVLSIAVGMIVQVLIKNSVVSACTSVVLIAASVLVYLVDSSLLEGLMPRLLSSLALFDRITSFQSGIFDMTAVVFYISVCALFVYLTVQSMEKKRWN